MAGLRSPVSSNGFTLVTKTDYWNVWAKSGFAQENQASFTASAISWLDSVLTRISSDFAYSMAVRPGTSWEASRMDCVLDPGAQGGAHTGTVFGSSGVSVSPDAIYNSDFDIPQFWWYILTMHETVNVVTGSIAGSWVWADGSPLWGGTSPFPNMCDIVVSGELGKKLISGAQMSRMRQDAGVMLFLDIHSRFGWRVYQSLFSYVNANGITDWSVYPEPLRTAILIWFLSHGANLTTFSTQQVLLDQFNSALRAISRLEVPADAYTEAQRRFPRPDVPHLY